MKLPATAHSDFDLETIVRTHQEKVRNICFRFVRNREDADDLAQEVFIQVYESLSHFRKESSISTWIYRISVNKSLDFLRKKKRKKRFGQLTSLFGFGQEQEGEVVIPSGDDPLRDLEARERKEILDAAIHKLPKNQKKAIVLSKYEGFSNKEIAEIMDLSVSAVEALLHRARKKLHDLLYQFFEHKV